MRWCRRPASGSRSRPTTAATARRCCAMPTSRSIAPRRRAGAPIAFFEESLNERAQERRQIETDLRLALERGEFELHYQPLFDLEQNRICSFEALIRWNHPTRGLVSPTDFIPVAEDTGLIVPIGAWVIREACAQAARWPEHIRDRGQRLAGPVPPRRAPRHDPPGARRRAASRPTGSRWRSPNRSSSKAAKRRCKLLHALRSLGVRIALDDFGTGYSSLSYLQSFPFDKLKIDRSFIQNLLTRDGASAIVRAITELAHALNIETTAEGVEETAQLMELRAHGCSSVQGFLFSEPMTAARRRAAVQRRRRRSEERRLSASQASADRSIRSMRVHPVSAIATRISASISFRTWATPAARRPPAHRPTPARAARSPRRAPASGPHRAPSGCRRPRRSAFAADRLGDRRQGARGRQHAVELPPAMVGYDDGVRAVRRGFARIVGIKDALDDQRPVPLLAHPVDILPADRRIEIGVDPAPGSR